MELALGFIVVLLEMVVVVLRFIMIVDDATVVNGAFVAS